MNREEIYKDLNEVFSDIFDDDIEVCDETVSSDIEGWDSLEHINLMMAIEKKFNIKFTMGEINKFKNVGEMVNAISQKIDS